ncbi:MAG TPA: DinB family protein [Terracidiphilus sp.]|nr:DinB family protein [Terracidiphilus sp.]
MTASSPAAAPGVEPWLSGSHTDVPAVARAVLHAMELALDDIRKWTEDLTTDEIYSEPLGLPSIAFHLRHIKNSIDRILTYAEGNQLSEGQLAALKAEQPDARKGDNFVQGNLVVWLLMLQASFDNAFARIRALADADFNTPRAVGRKQLPTSVGGALIHVADHTQRHVGQVVTTAKVLKALRA